MYSISLAASDRSPASQRPCAGVLVEYAGQRGILTARHVSESIKRSEDLSLLVGRRHYRLDPLLLAPRHPPALDRDNVWEASLPDLSFIPLPLPSAAELQTAGKAFYSIDRRVSDEAFDLYGEDGFFLAIGSPDGMVDREQCRLVQLRFATDVQGRSDIHGWDYVLVNLNLEDNPVLPKSLEGMSGGGVWRIRFQMNELGVYEIADSSKQVTLHGITCLQTNGRIRQLVAHGPASVYRRLPEFLASG